MLKEIKINLRRFVMETLNNFFLIYCLISFVIVTVVIVTVFMFAILSNNKKELRNKVHFYIVRDEYNELFLFLGKPIRKKNIIGKGLWTNATLDVVLLATNGLGTLPPLTLLSDYNVDENDFKDLKWEDEPVEVFLNMDD